MCKRSLQSCRAQTKWKWPWAMGPGPGSLTSTTHTTSLVEKPWKQVQWPGDGAHCITTYRERFSQHFHKGIHCFQPLLLVRLIAPLLCPTVFGVEPDLTREGGSIPVTLTFEEATGRNVMLLPLGSSDDGAHSQNEKINRYVGCHQI